MREYEQLNPAQLSRSLDVKLSRLKRLTFGVIFKSGNGM